MNYLLLRHDVPLSVIDVAERAAYLTSLDRANRGGPESFARFILASIERSIRRASGDD